MSSLCVFFFSSGFGFVDYFMFSSIESSFHTPSNMLEHLFLIAGSGSNRKSWPVPVASFRRSCDLRVGPGDLVGIPVGSERAVGALAAYLTFGGNVASEEEVEVAFLAQCLTVADFVGCLPWVHSLFSCPRVRMMLLSELGKVHPDVIVPIVRFLPRRHVCDDSTLLVQ